MRIAGISRAEGREKVRLAATLHWEEAERAPQEVWVETPREHADGFEPRGETFLLAALVPAMEQGERRILLEGALCPILAQGVLAAGRTLRAWFPAMSLPAIVATKGLVARPMPPVACAASTMSGGVDSLATIRANRLALPLDHPSSIRDALFVFGMNTYDFAEGEPVAARVRDFEERLARWGPLAAEARLRLVPVAANFRVLASSFSTWARRTIGAALAGVAHAFGGRFTRMLVPSSGARDLFAPDGYHPMLDPFYSSSSLTVLHDGQAMTRIDKLRLVADWDAALAVLQPCQQHEVGLETINCGRCNKCNRTMVELEAIGRLGDAVSFPRRAIDAAFVESMQMSGDFDVDYHGECVALLRERGRNDCARALEGRLAQFHRAKRPPLWRRLLGRGAAGA
ncbi:MAG: hypothetical protein ACT4PV_07915 [Planctomycetaceae bacterium]